MRAALLGIVLCTLASPLCAQDQEASGVVLVRVVAKLSAVLNDQLGGTRQTKELPDAIVATGSGLVVSRTGYVVTNHHVVADEEYRGEIGGAPARINLTVQRVEVFFPAASLGQAGVTLDASIVASDPDLDLAVLAIPGSDLPYVPLGDSDALRVGHPVSAVGYPLGEALEVNSDAGLEDLVAATAPGAVSALRPESDGSLRYIQTSAPLNRGNSGGPLLDRYGFAVGVIQAKMRGAEGIGFAIPINLVKEFLARSGLDTSLPATRLTLGHLYDSPEKLIRFQAPAGFDDTGQTRLSVDSGTSLPGLSLHIDRIVTPWSLDQVEQELSSRGVFEQQDSMRAESPVREGRVLRGQARLRAGRSTLRMLYAVIDQGPEKIVARYVGSSEQIAFNESVLAASLASIEPQSMLTPKPTRAPEVAFVRASPAVLADVVTSIPSGWVLDGGVPTPCAGLHPARESLVVSPRWDFATSFRIGRFENAFDEASAAARCAGKGSATDSTYQKRFSKFGVDYSVEGRFVASGSRTMQIEVVAPTRTFAVAREAFARWMAELGLQE